jgi:hypothetical protein
MHTHRAILAILAAAVLACAVWATHWFVARHQEAPQPVLVHHTQSSTGHLFEGAVPLPPCTALGSMVTAQGAELSIQLMTSPISECGDTAPVMAPFSASFMPASGITPVFAGLTLDGKAVLYQVVED